ncbi:MAG TPA: NUDIX domain-containing protein [Candidatus Woesebacteria bacterium]|nr:NUDIX domain-containing protein [Candidatus Woesebacteria bacterium]
MTQQISRMLQPAVTVFLRHQNHFLFIQKNFDRVVDAGRINGVGGKVEKNEDFLAAALRETAEETGLKPRLSQVRFAGLLHNTGGYPQDWLVAFFVIEVSSRLLPMGKSCPEGTFHWWTVSELKKQKAVLVDDLHYLFPEYIMGPKQFFAHADIDEAEKVSQIQISTL